MDKVIVNFSDDRAWEEWGEWVFRRCEVSSNDKLVLILHKVCKISAHHLDGRWATAFSTKLLQLIRHRLEFCSDDDVYKNLKKFEAILEPRELLR